MPMPRRYYGMNTWKRSALLRALNRGDIDIIYDAATNGIKCVEAVAIIDKLLSCCDDCAETGKPCSEPGGACSGAGASCNRLPQTLGG